MQQHLRRSLLFVPACEPRRIEKALGLAADALIFDLEDSTPVGSKAEARLALGELLPGITGQRDIIVRTNAPDSELFEQDLQALANTGISSLMLPKCGNPQALQQAIRQVSQLMPETEILALLESAAGVTFAREICALPEVSTLCFGHADFSLDMGLAETVSDRGAAFYARSQLAITGKGLGVRPIDTVCLEVKDDALITEDVELGKSLGFSGKLCIHPRQVEITNRVYSPSPEQIEKAQALLAAWDQAQAEGKAVISFNHKMVDAPLVKQQQAVIAQAKATGLLED